MGLEDREYMRDVPIYRRLTGRGGGGDIPPQTATGSGGAPPARRPVRPHHNGARRWAWSALGIAIILCAAAYGLVSFHHGLPSTIFRIMRPAHSSPAPTLTLTTPAPAPASVTPKAPVYTTPTHHVGLIRGTRLLSYGGKLELSGHTASVPGTVRVLGKWNSGAWVTFAVANAGGRRFSFTFPMNHRGTLHLKIVQPDGSTSVGTYQVS